MPEDDNVLRFLLSLTLLVLAIVLLLAGLHRRSRGQRIIAGVCGGLADTLGWDVRVVRGLYVLATISSAAFPGLLMLATISSAAFPGLLIYIILWVLMPED